MTHPAFTSVLKPVFGFPLQDRQSRERFLIGCGIMLAGFIVPIVPGLIVFGYALRVLQSSARGEQPSMTPWDDIPGYLSLGFRGTVVSFLFTLPGLALFLFGFLVYFGTFFAIPISSAIAGDSGETFILGALLGMATMFISLALGMLLLIFGLAPLPASLAHFVAEDKLSAAFRLREWGAVLSANRLGYFISFVVVIGIYGLMNLAFMMLYYTLVLLCLAYFIMLPVSFYALLIGAAFFGDNYHEGLAAVRQDGTGEEAPSA